MRFLDRIKGATRTVLDPVLSRLAISMGYRIERNIPLALQRKAVAETASYVATKMNNVGAFKSAQDLLIWSAERCRDQDGMVLEFGVWKGKSLRIIAKILIKPSTDSILFKVCPKTGAPEFRQARSLCKTRPRVSANTKLVVGWFSETLGPFLAEHPGLIKFLHIDCDLYSSAREVLEKCAERLRPGSIIVFDEYFNYPNWQEGEFKAFQETVARHRLSYRYIAYNSIHVKLQLKLLLSNTSILCDEVSHVRVAL